MIVLAIVNICTQYETLYITSNIQQKELQNNYVSSWYTI